MYRTHNNGELRLSNKGEKVKLCGWVQKNRDLGAMTFIDLRDRYGITQLYFNMEEDSNMCNDARKIGREYVIMIEGEVLERYNKNKNLSTGEIEIKVEKLEIINEAIISPFTIENDTDGGEEIRMKYRYLDLRRKPLQDNLILRSKLNLEVRNYLSSLGFLDIETPFLIKSTPEGARDFVVPSRMNTNEFYALPQSPQTFKQLLMVSGFDKYFQIVKCFRDEDLRSDRQPEFTQIDCEMAFVKRDDVLRTFEGMIKHLFKVIKGIDINEVPIITYDFAMENYGNDKPDTRFDMKFNYLDNIAKGKGFQVFDNSESIIAINAKNINDSFTRKDIDYITEYIKQVQIGAKGLIYVRCNEDGTYKSSVDKFFDNNELQKWAELCNAQKGDIIFILSGDKKSTQKQMSELRLELGRKLGLMDNNTYNVLWVVDFPLLEYDEENNRYHAMHHPFTSSINNDLVDFDINPANIKANAYDMVINGVEVGGGSIRIHNRKIQEKMFELLGFTEEEAKKQFGFLMNAFEYGAPPHGGIAFGFDRLTSLFTGDDSIRDVIAFPKNNKGRDVMLDAPDTISQEQLNELYLNLKK